MMSLPVLLPGPMFLLGGLCPWSHVPSRSGVSVQEGSLSRGVSEGRPPPESEKRAVSILLECFLFTCYKIIHCNKDDKCNSI